MAKVKLPKKIQAQMSNWRNGSSSFPNEYIEFHKDLAEKQLEVIKQLGLKVEKEEMQRDGWGDGMKCLHVEAIFQGETIKLHWHDSNQEFFIDSKSGGAFPFKPLRVGA